MRTRSVWWDATASFWWAAAQCWRKSRNTSWTTPKRPLRERLRGRLSRSRLSTSGGEGVGTDGLITTDRGSNPTEPHRSWNVRAAQSAAGGELLHLRFAGHIIEEASTAYERVCGRICLNELRPSHLIYTGELGPSRSVLVYQQFTNLFAAVVGIILTAPFMVIAALMVRFSSPGPIFYRQVRVGLNSAPFTLYKFRSMRVDAEAGTGAVWATKDDPRITRAGRVLRKLRLDELPQLFNVLKGEMAIVGPRPERPEFVKTLSERIPYYHQRHAVLPGITGWAQINFKYGDSLEDTVTKLEFDLYYIKNMSAGLDLYIIFHTLKAMLLSRGAQ